MAKDNVTPEERLLKIIENPNTEKRKIPLIVKARSINVNSVKDWFSNIHLDKKTLKKVNLNLISRFIAVICALITLIWIFDFTRTGIILSKRFKRAASGEGLSTADERQRPNISVGMDEVMAQVRKRNIFTFLPTKEEAAKTVSVGPVLGDFKLVGILWSENPQAMIENSKEQKTYFVNKKDKIGDIEVREILRDKVIVGKGEEEWELR